MILSLILNTNLGKEVMTMFKKTRTVFDKILSFFQPVKDIDGRNDWTTSVLHLTDDEIFSFTNKALSNYKYLTLSFDLNFVKDNQYLLKYLKSTHDALEILRIVILSRSKDLRSLFTWNMRIIDTIDELKSILTPYYPEINRSLNKVEFNINELKFLLSSPQDDISYMFKKVDKLDPVEFKMNNVNDMFKNSRII